MAKNEFPWKEGHYKCMEGDNIAYLMEVRENKTVTSIGGLEVAGKLESGTFECSDTRGLVLTDSTSYNVQHSLKHDLPSYYCVLGEDGMMMTFMNGTIAEWIDEKEFEVLKAETDPADNYPTTYIPCPENPGVLVWISGGTGTGKSTTALSMKEKFGYILYEGDAFVFGYNPYVGAAPKGGGRCGTRALSGVSQERKEACNRMLNEGYMNLMFGRKTDPSVWERGYDMMCDDIIGERKRLGGDWVVNQAVYTRDARDIVRKKLGPNLKFVILEMDQELQIKRLAKRSLSGVCHANELSGHITEGALEKAKKDVITRTGGLEKAQTDEPNTFALEITESMSLDDVVVKILAFVK